MQNVLVSISKNGAIHIPAWARKKTSLPVGETLVAKIYKNKIVIRKTKDIMDFAGVVPPNKRMPSDFDFCEYMEKHYCDDYKPL